MQLTGADDGLFKAEPSDLHVGLGTMFPFTDPLLLESFFTVMTQGGDSTKEKKGKKKKNKQQTKPNQKKPIHQFYLLAPPPKKKTNTHNQNHSNPIGKIQ